MVGLPPRAERVLLVGLLVGRSATNAAGLREASPTSNGDHIAQTELDCLASG